MSERASSAQVVDGGGAHWRASGARDGANGRPEEDDEAVRVSLAASLGLCCTRHDMYPASRFPWGSLFCEFFFCFLLALTRTVRIFLSFYCPDEDFKIEKNNLF